MKKLLLMLALLTPLALAEPAPSFTAQTADGKTVKLSDYAKKFVVLEWVNFECPFVRGQYDPGKMQALQQKWAGKGVVWLSVCSSAEGKQGYRDAAAMQAQLTKEKSQAAHMILDPDGKLGKLYGAKTTPHMFIIDPKGEIIYAGAIDDKAKLNYVDQALTEALAGKPVSQPLTQSYGCSVKYNN